MKAGVWFAELAATLNADDAVKIINSKFKTDRNSDKRFIRKLRHDTDIYR